MKGIILLGCLVIFLIIVTSLDLPPSELIYDDRKRDISEIEKKLSDRVESENPQYNVEVNITATEKP